MFLQMSTTANANTNKVHISTEQAFIQVPSIAHEAYTYLSQAFNKPEVARFIFVRHGESISNKDKIIAGRTIDEGLSEAGIAQALEVGRILSEMNITINGYYSSPSQRARQTVSLIEERLNIQFKPIEDERLYEKFYGPYEGAVENVYSPLVKAEEEDNSGPEKTFEEKFAYKYHPDMESMQEVLQRVSAFLKDVSQQHRGETILVGTHNGVMKALFMSDAASQGFDIDYRSFSLSNCALLIVEIKDGLSRVEASNKLTFKK